MERSYICTTARVYVRKLIVIRKENCHFVWWHHIYIHHLIGKLYHFLSADLLAYLYSTRLYYSSFPQTIPVTPTSGDYLTLRCSLQLTWYCRHVQNYRMLSYKRELFSNDILTPRFFDIKTGQGQWTQIVHEIFYAREH
jgi:hypothetical protein